MEKLISLGVLNFYLNGIQREDFSYTKRLLFGIGNICLENNSYRN